MLTRRASEADPIVNPKRWVPLAQPVLFPCVSCGQEVLETFLRSLILPASIVCDRGEPCGGSGQKNRLLKNP